MHVLALDVGTSSVRAAVLDAGCQTPVGPVARVAYDLYRPTPEAAEVPPPRLWEAFTAAARQAARGIDRIDGIGLCCMSPALVLLDAKDRPLAPVRTPRDRRARAAARQVWAAEGERYLNAVGSRPLPGGTSGICFRQLLSECPYLIRETRSYLHAHGWLAFRLTGVKAFDPADAAATGLYGTLTDRRWSSHLCELFNVDPAWLPPVVCGSTPLGPLLPPVASELGVPPGVPVRLGTTDTSSAILAAGLGAGDLLHAVGATQLLAAVVERPAPDVRRLVRPLGVGDAFVHLTHNPVGGAALDWLYELCFRDQVRSEFFTATIDEALSRETRVSLDPAHLGGERLEIDAHRAAFRDLTLATDRLDLLAALLKEMRRQHARAV
jgi:sugar (pentulose or hexulose) kinase